MIKSASYVIALAAAQLAACSTEPAQKSDEAPANAAAAADAPAAEPAPQGDERLVLAFGDSLYAGYGLEPSQSFPAVLQRELAKRGIRARVINAGVSGDTTAGGLQRLAFTLDGLERTPDLAIVGLGGNDVLRGLDPAVTRANLDTMLTQLKARGVPVLLTGMMAPRNLGSSYVQSFERIYPELAAKHGAKLDPFFLEGVITRSDLLLPDGIHPNARGVETVTNRIAPQVAEALRPSAD